MASIDDKRMAVDGEKKEEEEFATGPFSVLMHSVKHNTQVAQKHSFFTHSPLLSQRWPT